MTALSERAPTGFRTALRSRSPVRRNEGRRPCPRCGPCRQLDLGPRSGERADQHQGPGRTCVGPASRVAGCRAGDGGAHIAGTNCDVRGAGLPLDNAFSALARSPRQCARACPCSAARSTPECDQNWLAGLRPLGLTSGIAQPAATGGGRRLGRTTGQVAAPGGRAAT